MKQPKQTQKGGQVIRFPTAEERHQKECAAGRHCLHAQPLEPDVSHCCWCDTWLIPDDDYPFEHPALFPGKLFYCPDAVYKRVQ